MLAATKVHLRQEGSLSFDSGIAVFFLVFLSGSGKGLKEEQSFPFCRRCRADSFGRAAKFGPLERFLRCD